MHRRIFKRNEERIHRSVMGYTVAFQRYEREYNRGIRRYQRRASLTELDLALARAEIAYVGDYHTLAQSQRAFLRLLRRLPPERPVVVGLEFVQGRFQAVLDAYIEGTLSDEEFLKQIEHQKHWVFGGFKNFKEILMLARERHYHVIGIDSLGHGPAGSSLQKRDAYAASRLAHAVTTHPHHLVMVLIGELHIAPMHLPAAVDAALSTAGQHPSQLILYQNCHELYFALAEHGREHQTELVRLEANRYCLMNTPPIVAQQSFLNWVDVESAEPQLEAPEHNFKEAVRLIASFLDLPIGNALDEVEIVTVADLSFLARLKERGDFTRFDLHQVKQQILRSESYYIPRAKTVYLGNLNVNHAAEEATHFIRHVVAGVEEPRLLVDAFYARCLEEALGFLGSKLINHKRKHVTLEALAREKRSRAASRRDRLLATLVLRHVGMEAGKKVRGMGTVYSCDAGMFNAVTHVLGYRLGERLYYSLVDGLITKEEVRKVFLDRFDEEGDALTTYLYLVGRTATVKVPERM